MKFKIVFILAPCLMLASLFSSCSKEAELKIESDIATVKSNSTSQTIYYRAMPGWDRDDCECVGNYECPVVESYPGEIPDYFEAVEEAIDFVETNSPSLAVFGYSINKKNEIKIDFTYRGSRNSTQTCGAFRIGPKGDQLPGGLARALGYRSINLLSGNYRISSSKEDGKVIEYGLIAARIK